MPHISVYSTATEMLKALDSSEVSSVELLEMHLDHIEQHNGPINAIVIRNYEEARLCAQEADLARAWLFQSGVRSPARYGTNSRPCDPAGVFPA